MENENYVVKFKIQDKTSLRVKDLIRGEISFICGVHIRSERFKLSSTRIDHFIKCQNY